MIREREFLVGLTFIVAQAFPARVEQNAIDRKDFTVNCCNFDQNCLIKYADFYIT